MRVDRQASDETTRQHVGALQIVGGERVGKAPFWENFTLRHIQHERL